MEDNLQRFVKQQRAAFDTEEAPVGLWSRIETRLPQRKGKSVIKMFWLKAAAAAIVLFLAGTGVYYLVKKDRSETAARTKPGTDDTLAKEPGPDTNGIAELAPDLAGQVYQFASIIETKKTELRRTAGEQPELFERFEEDLHQLDSSYQVLKDGLAVSPDREALLQALIVNLEMQLDVLNRQLNAIRDIKNSKNNSNEKFENTTL
jgi:hypothetical protein